MAEPKNMDALVEVEYCLGRYLDANVAGVMDDVRRDLIKKAGSGACGMEHELRRDSVFTR